MASVMSESVQNGVVYAYDGNVGFGERFYIADITGHYYPRLSGDQRHFHKINKKYNVDRDPRGQVTYYNGEYKPLGYFPNTEINPVPAN